MTPNSMRLSLPRKMMIGLWIWWCFIDVWLGLRGRSLSSLVAQLNAVPRRRMLRYPPERLSWMVTRSLCIGPFRPRCLSLALVLYRLLAAADVQAQLVIGLRPGAPSAQAHAWVEVDGIDIGPADGGALHVAIVRYS